MIKKVICGISGGVDSAVAAHLLKKQGKNVVGVFMRNWDKEEEGTNCTLAEDEEDAEYVCKHLNIPLFKVDFVKEYWNEVFSPFLDGYKKGLTPNPDVLCNKRIKFGYFHDYCLNHLGANIIATGHYAGSSAGPFGQFRQKNTKVKLLRARDCTKDQTLFLSQISQSSLYNSIFPLGPLLKNDVKEIAKSIGLQKIADKKESTGICFIGKRDFKHFISQYQEKSQGLFVDLDTGLVVGEHSGVHHYTKGQRTLIGGLKQAYFVVDRDPTSQVIQVVAGSNHPALFTSSLYTSHPHWICDDPFQNNPSQTLNLQFRFQHTHTPMDCLVTQVYNTNNCHNGRSVRLFVELPEALRAISPGQYATFYNGDECLGSAVIERTPLESQNLSKATLKS